MSAYNAAGSDGPVSNEITQTVAGSPTPTPAPSTKFKIGNTVKPSPNVANVRATPGGTLLGTQSLSANGVVNQAPGFGTYDPSVPPFWWWNVTFKTGPSGWIGEDDLVLVSASTPTPTATPAPTFNGWNAKLAAEEATKPSQAALRAWNTANPATAD